MEDPVNEVGTASIAHGLRSTTIASTWEDALITGNGRQGALCFGRATAMNITLSHERLFMPVSEPLPAPRTSRILPELRALLAAGYYQEAAARVCEFAEQDDPGYSHLRWIDPLVGAATLTFRSPSTCAGGEDTSDERAADFRTGLVTIRSSGPETTITHQVFASRPANVISCRTTATATSTTDATTAVVAPTVHGVIALGPIRDRPAVPITFTTAAAQGWLTMKATFPDRPGNAIAGYIVTCRVVASGGSMTVEHPGGTGTASAGMLADEHPAAALRVTGAQELLILARIEIIQSDGILAPCGDPAIETLASAHDALFDEHAATHRALFDRIHLRLGERHCPDGAGASSGEHSPGCQQPASEEHLAHPEDPALIARLFDAGRYAIISSTGTLPPTLQGVWSGDYNPAWCSGYTLNGNLPSALASAIPTSSPDLLLPLFNLLEQRRDDFRENARRLYGARGVLLPTHCSSHGKQNHFGPVWCQTFWTAGAAWMARFYHDYWRVTGDMDFLANRAWPFMTEAAAFYEDFLVKRRGQYTFMPSYSPENEPAGTGSQAAINATLDVAAVRDLMRNLLECQRVVAEHRGAGGREPGDRASDSRAVDSEDHLLSAAAADRWRAILDGLPGYQVSQSGELAEWLWPGLHDNHAHRHASQLYPVWYGDPDLLSSPALLTAAAKTVERRLAWRRGDAAASTEAPPGDMAFGLVQLGLAAARLGMADTAYEIVTMLAADYWRPSLVSTHNAGAIFNVDISGGLVAVVIAMLVSSGRDTVDLLPAVPQAWASGEIRGVFACDQVTIRRLTWTPTRLDVELTTTVERRVTIGVGNTRTPVALSPDRPTHLVAARSPAKLRSHTHGPNTYLSA